MDVNKRIFRIFLIIIGIVATGCMIFIQYVSLAEPIFFKQYADLSVNLDDDDYQYGLSDELFSFNYFTNAEDKRVVSYVSFPEYPDLHIQPFEDDWGMFGLDFETEQPDLIGQLYGRYSLREVLWQIVDLPEESLDNELILNEAIFYFSDGSEVKTDIGQIRLSRSASDSEIIEFLSGSSSSDGDSRSNFKVLKPINFSGFEAHFLDQISQRVEMKINNQNIYDLEELQLEEGDTLTIVSQIKPAQTLQERYTRFNLSLKLIFTDEKDQEYYLTWKESPSFREDFSFTDLYKYTKEQEGL
ncbi:hypothetical protein SAMN04488134_101224 [Amphibacillus marinus]|uniref:Uncharacterized protein n=1 Tax=Amphibacillus marinus TaxID=872970 RepID=A0A1H8H0H1_9BACI|nr:hypothetical protein [Amphibacillus marinus]SEN49842.1 hypothetical protein SAMN04488134_101224 [Amphibacillus marinus]